MVNIQYRARDLNITLRYYYTRQAWNEDPSVKGTALISQSEEPL